MNISQALERLNEEQLNAALDIYGPSMVIAGPGSGKTATLVARTANMIYNGISGKNIILFTFTKKAANEIKERVINIIGDQGRSIVVGTYHSVCCRLLRNYPGYIGLTKNFSIYDADDSLKLLKEIIKRTGYEKLDPDKISWKISDYKCRLKNPSDAMREAETNLEQMMAEVYRMYEEELIRKNALDFDNLIYKTVRLMQSNHDIAKEINDKYQYIVADESHDSSLMDLKLIELLAGERENICMILDNDQSIYSFRGANIDAVINMSKVFNETRTHLLNRNYRSTQTIVEASKTLISNNPALITKDLVSNNEEGNPISIFEESTPDTEATRIVKIIKFCTEKQGCKYSDIAVLYRMNYLSRKIEDALLKYRIPYTIIGSVNFYSRKEIKDIMSYFRFVINSEDRLALERSINVPKRGVGQKAFESIISYSEENRCGLMTALEQVTLTGKARQGVDQYLELIKDLKEVVDVSAPNQCIAELLNRTRYLDYVRETEDAPTAEDRLSNIEELIELSNSFETMEELSNNITLDSELADKNSEIKDSVQLLTMHSSKGLEWDNVIMSGLVEGILPSHRSLDGKPLEEERRVAYIGMTRAKKQLFITRPKYIIKNGRAIYAQESRFLNEVDEKYINFYGKQ